MTDRDDYKRDLRSANVARQKEWDAFDQLTLAYRGNELAGEVGEACNVIKKLERERLGIAGSRDTIAHLAEELADVIICTDLIAMQAGIDLDAAVVAKFNASSEKVGLKTRLRAASVKAGEVVAEGEPDFAASIAKVIKEESESEAACGWKSCSGCHETNEGAETGWYPYSKMFGCFVGSGCSECGGLGVVWEYWSKDALDQMSADDDSINSIQLEWRDGPPPKPWSEEWFIAETTFRDRVVLRALPDDYTYDFKTADETYIKADKIKRWMQFPDSQYIAVPTASVGAMREALSGLIEAVRRDADEDGKGISGYTSARLSDARNALAANQSDVEALAVTTAERPGTVTSEPEPSTSDTYDVRYHENVLDQLQRPSDTPPPPQAVEVVGVDEVAAVIHNHVWTEDSSNLSGVDDAARALLAKFKMEGR